MRYFVFRMLPDEDLREQIDKLVVQQQIKAGAIVSCVGYLKKAALRMPDGKTEVILEGEYEIVSLSGTVEAGNSHLHIALADQAGKMTGGHLKWGSIVGVSAEVVIAELEGLRFSRKMDPQTGYEELVVNEDQT